MAASRQRIGCEIRHTSEFNDALRDHVSVGHFFVCVNQELLSNLWRGQALGGEMVSPIAKRTSQFGRERIVQQLNYVVAPRAVVRRHSPLIEAALCFFDRF